VSVRTRLLWGALLVLTAGGFVAFIVLTTLQVQPSGIGLWLLAAWALGLLVIVLALETGGRPSGEALLRKRILHREHDRPDAH
jgi:hypothetical protein